jgi:hypothetical protein
MVELEVQERSYIKHLTLKYQHQEFGHYNEHIIIEKLELGMDKYDLFF